MDVIVVGGFHEIFESLKENKYSIIGYFDHFEKKEFLEYKWLGNDDFANKIMESLNVSNIIITPDDPSLRKKLFTKYNLSGYVPVTFTHNLAYVSSSAKILSGSFIQKLVHISSNTIIGKMVKVNVCANIMHDCIIGDFTTIAPNAVILGNVKIGNSCYIGANTTILPNITITDNVIIGAGAIVTKNISESGTYIGSPAILFEKMKILTVISNYNEEKVIVKTITDFLNNNDINSDLLVIDNCSSDQSVKLIKTTGVDYLVHPVNTGGSAGVIKTAFSYAYYHNYDIYCHLDGDNQHLASELKKLIDPFLNNDKVDIIIGSRYIEKIGFQSTFLRRLGINLFSKILSLITKTKLTDITSGFRAYNKNVIEYFGKNVKYEIEACVQMLLLSHFAGFKIKEVPVQMRPRLSGKSEINLTNALKFPWYGFINLIGTLIQKHK